MEELIAIILNHLPNNEIRRRVDSELRCIFENPNNDLLEALRHAVSEVDCILTTRYWNS